MSIAIAKETQSDDVVDELLEDGSDSTESAKALSPLNDPTLINRGELQRHLGNDSVVIGDGDLASLTEEQAEALWEWMEKGDDFSDAETDKVVDFTPWLASLPGFMVQVPFDGPVDQDSPSPDTLTIALIHTGISSPAYPEEQESPAPTPSASTATPYDDKSPTARMEKHLKEIFKASTRANKLRSTLEDAESEINAAKAREKECLENLHAAEKELSRVIADARSGQQKLPFGDEVEKEKAVEKPEMMEAVIDSNTVIPADYPISELGVKPMKKLVGAIAFDAAKENGDPLGLSDSQLEKLAEKDISTICGLEKFMRENAFWHWDIKGFGDSAVQRLITTLTTFRASRPVE